MWRANDKSERRNHEQLIAYETISCAMGQFMPRNEHEGASIATICAEPWNAT